MLKYINVVTAAFVPHEFFIVHNSTKQFHCSHTVIRRSSNFICSYILPKHYVGLQEYQFRYNYINTPLSRYIGCIQVLTVCFTVYLEALSSALCTLLRRMLAYPYHYVRASKYPPQPHSMADCYIHSAARFISYLIPLMLHLFSKVSIADTLNSHFSSSSIRFTSCLLWSLSGCHYFFVICCSNFVYELKLSQLTPRSCPQLVRPQNPPTYSYS